MKITESIKRYIKRKTGISYLEDKIGALQALVSTLSRDLSLHEKLVREATTVSADVRMRGASTIIVAGRFKNKDFVKIYPFGDGEFSEIVSHLEQASRYHKINRIDAPSGLRWHVVDRLEMRNLL